MAPLCVTLHTQSVTWLYRIGDNNDHNDDDSFMEGGKGICRTADTLV